MVLEKKIFLLTKNVKICRMIVIKKINKNHFLKITMGRAMNGLLTYNTYNGNLSDKSIGNAIKNGDLFIAPYDSTQLQPAGYNLTPTRCFYSTKRKCLLDIIEDADGTYVIIDKNDTVLVRTRESIAVSNIISGAFYSKVKVVSEGFGHVSTTLDPGWEGQLLISLNNPTNKKMKFPIERKVYGKTIYNSFVTLEFIGLDTETSKKSDNPPGRLDILENTLEKNLSTLKKGKIEDLQQLIEKLHQYENESLTDITLRVMSEEDRERYENIYLIQDETEFENELRTFMMAMKKKYLRKIKKRFSDNAEESIRLINEYVTRKLKYKSIRSKVTNYIVDNKWYIIGLMIVLALGTALCIAKFKVAGTAKTEILLTVIGMALMYFIQPLLSTLIEKLKK